MELKIVPLQLSQDYFAYTLKKDLPFDRFSDPSFERLVSKKKNANGRSFAGVREIILTYNGLNYKVVNL